MAARSAGARLQTRVSRAQKIATRRSIQQQWGADPKHRHTSLRFGSETSKRDVAIEHKPTIQIRYQQGAALQQHSVLCRAAEGHRLSTMWPNTIRFNKIEKGGVSH